jgi:hypothetical protein
LNSDLKNIYSSESQPFSGELARLNRTGLANSNPECRCLNFIATLAPRRIAPRLSRVLVVLAAFADVHLLAAQQTPEQCVEQLLLALG